MFRRELYLEAIALIFILFFVFPFVHAAETDSAFGPSITKENYILSRSKVERTVEQSEVLTDSIVVQNLLDRQLRVSWAVSSEVSSFLEFENESVTVDGKNSSSIVFHIYGTEVGTYSGEISLSGDVIEKLPVNVTVTNESKATLFLIELNPLKKVVTRRDMIEANMKITKILNKDLSNVSFEYSLFNLETNESRILSNESRDVGGSFEQPLSFNFPTAEPKNGNYYLQVSATHEGKIVYARAEYSIVTPWLEVKLFGFLPIWLLLSTVLFLGVSGFAFVFIRRYIENKKKYRMQLYVKTLPQKGERTLSLGKVAETNIPANLEMDALTTHAVVAGATGGGKSIAAQVLIEEALMKNVAVIVFDPTAQWSGMLRKCEDKKMLSYYPNFGLKPSDARAFPGNVRQILSARQVIDIKKHMNPGQITIFTFNKLDPSEMDTFVASVIASIFRSGPEEYPGLRLLLVFDEVHRLLPKFGGSGKGFLQIERACREFRKWGFGVMLVSQVLSDFVGEIKANINTEVQMRTRDESDLNRLKTKYGEEFLQSLIKASVGVGMFVNPRYNRGRPYFINFRPILHNTRRLGDDVLEKYNNYGEVVDDLDYQIEQLEQEKVDVFDLKMELKLVKDKLMSGNFTVVDIYLEGLKPRIEKNWQVLGKKPKKKEIELIDEASIAASIKEAEKAHKDAEALEKKEGVGAEAKKEDPKTRILKPPFTFNNGMMIATIKELQDVLPDFDQDVWGEHVNDEKHDVADWLGKAFSPEMGVALKQIKDKKQFVTAINDFLAGKLKPAVPEPVKAADNKATPAAAKPASTAASAPKPATKK